MTLPPQGEPLENLVRALEDLGVWLDRAHAVRVPAQITAISAAPGDVAQGLAAVLQYLQDLHDIQPPADRLRQIEDVADFFGDQDERAEHLEAQVRDILRRMAAVVEEVRRATPWTPPPGTADYQVLVWNNTDKLWEPGWVRAH